MIHHGTVDWPSPCLLQRQGVASYRSGDDTFFSWEGVGKFRIRANEEIWIDPDPASREETLVSFLLGPILGVLIHQRGHLVLHASSVAFPEGAVVFLGEKGRGKSTLAAALLSRGHALVTDDLAVLEDDGRGNTLIYPGYPFLKLWPESLESVGLRPESMPRVHPMFEKRVHSLRTGLTTEPVPLKRIYLLGEGDRHSILPLPIQQAWVELVRHTYCAAFLPHGGAEANLNQCVHLAQQVSVRQLRVHRSLDDLDALVRLIEEDQERHDSALD